MERDRQDRDPTAPEADVDEQQRPWDEDDDEAAPRVPDDPGVPEADAWEQAQDAALDDDFDRR